MWRIILRPDVLFTVATVQALSPYLFWQFGIGEFKGQVSLTYLPVIVWVSGWVAFIAGTRLIKRPKLETPVFAISASERTVRLATLVVMVIICAQLLSLARLYGGVPILSYIRQDGAIQIGAAVALQEESAVGQVGSVYITTAVLHALVLLLIIRNLEQNRRDQCLIIAAFLVLLAAHAINGKRQGLVRCAVFLITGLVMYARDPLNALTRATRLVRTKAAAHMLLAVSACLLFLSFGYLAYVRNQGRYQRDSLQELIAYQEYSLVNFEIQCAASGLGPHKVDYLLWLRRMVPWKLMDAVGLGDTEMPARYEPWAPAGLYEDIQWSLGLTGAVLYAFVLGLLTMWCYTRALCSPFYLLAYCQISFSLMLAHSFNEFVSLSWIPGPICLFALLCGTLRRQRSHLQQAAAIGPEFRSTGEYV